VNPASPPAPPPLAPPPSSASVSWGTWLALWLVFLGGWRGAACLHAHLGDSEERAHVVPLRPRPIKPLVRVTPAPELRTRTPRPPQIASGWWPPYDTLDATLPSAWELHGSTAAWFDLEHFFRLLHQTSWHAVDVFHWGDSQIEGDRITGTLRASWQRTWGGNGSGWVLPEMPAASFAIASNTEGGVGRRAGFGRGRDSTARRLPFFAVNDMAASSRWRIAANPASHANHKRWTTTTVWTSEPSAWSLEVDGLPVAVPAAETAFQHVDHPHVDRDIALTFGASTLLGVQLGSPHGVRVHNLPMRGASGTLFDDVPASDWQHLRAHHVPGLVLLQFGGNAVPSLTTQASAQRYARNVARNIRHIQGMLPGVPIVFIGPSDMGRHPGEFPGLAHVVHALKDAVVANDALYWDLQAVMGGQGSMAAWMAEGLAGPDGVHFSPRGAKLVGQRLDVALRHEFKARFGTALHAVPAIRSPQEAGTP